MMRALQFAKLGLLLAATAVCLLLAAGLWQMRGAPAHADAVLIRANGVLGRAEGVESKINASAVNLDHATAAWAGAAQQQAASVSGLVAEAHGTLETANRQLAHIAPLLDQARQTIADAGADAQQLTQAGASAIATANGTLAAAQPLLEASTRTVNHVDAETLALSPELRRMIHASADTAEHVSGIADNTQKMTTRLERDFDAQKPWWKQALPVGVDAAKLWECFTRGNCF